MSATAGRIPVYNNDPYMWFKAMRERGLLFHPDDDPADIVAPDCDYPHEPFRCLFNPMEIAYINNVMRWIWKRWGDPCEFAYQLAVDCGDIVE